MLVVDFFAYQNINSFNLEIANICVLITVLFMTHPAILDHHLLQFLIN